MINGTVKVQKSIYNITNNLAEAGVSSEYSAVQGYTINNTNTASFIAVKTKEGENDVAVAYITNLNEKPNKVSTGRGLGHGNDCAFYKNNYFIAMGCQKFKTTDIKCLNKSLNHVATYSYVPMSSGTPLEYISCIAYLTGDYFVVGAGLRYAVCHINETAKTLNEVSRFNINKDEAETYLSRGSIFERLGQGIFCIGQNFYKLFSYRSPNAGNSPIKYNDLAVFKMPGSFPYSGEVSFIGCYSCDRPEKDYFELESLASPDNGNTFYIAANVKETYATKQKDSIYSATLSNS